jgi:hypothetical protein
VLFRSLDKIIVYSAIAIRLVNTELKLIIPAGYYEDCKTPCSMQERQVTANQLLMWNMGQGFGELFEGERT